MYKGKKNIPEISTPVSASAIAQAAEAGLFKIPPPPPNMKYCGRPIYSDASKRKIEKANDPIESYSNAGTIVNLPPADFQKRRRLFYHQSAAEICRLFPGLYKLVIRK